MSEKMEHSDLCSTCMSASDCTFPKDPGKGVHNCEEFTVDGRQGQNSGKTGASREASSGAADGALRGLCSNCENRKTCVFPKPEGGVWHCEEYA